MKELSIEEKAKRYDEAIEKAKEMIKSMTNIGGVANVADIQYLFTELKESEGEKTKRILHSISSKISFYLRDIFSEEEYQCFDAWSNAWLEKQGEQKSVIEMKTTEESLGIDSETYNKIVDECIYGEQKPAWSEDDETTKNNISHIIRQYDKISKKENQPCWYVGDCLLWMQNIKDRVIPQQKAVEENKGNNGGISPNSEWSEEDEAMWAEISDLLWEGYKQSGSKFSWDDIRNWVNPKLKSLKDRYTWKPSDEQMNALRVAIGDEQGSDCCGALRDLLKDLKSL